MNVNSNLKNALFKDNEHNVYNKNNNFSSHKIRLGVGVPGHCQHQNLVERTLDHHTAGISMALVAGNTLRMILLQIKNCFINYKMYLFILQPHTADLQMSNIIQKTKEKNKEKPPVFLGAAIKQQEGLKLRCRTCGNIWVYCGKNNRYANCSKCHSTLRFNIN